MGLSLRCGMVTKVNYDSPFKGLIVTGDIIMFINGTLVTFEDKLSWSKGSSSIKVDIGFIRLKSRMGRNPLPSCITQTDGHVVEQAILYQFKFLKLGLNIQQAEDRIIVNYTNPDTSSHICLNIGETILAVEDQPVTSLEDVKRKILDACYKHGMAKILLDYPTTDMLKNGIRSRLSNAAKSGERPVYAIGADVKKFAQEGIEKLKESKEPDSILSKDKRKTIDSENQKISAEGKSTDNKSIENKSLENSKEKLKLNEKKSLEKMKSQENHAHRKANPIVKKLMFFKKGDKGLSFRDTADEHDIPSEWNSKLFVVLPPLKTIETEKEPNRNALTKYEKTPK
ncbi:unnamed protein product [Caenorhabditis bovis]|uniref:PDZ domain-containing protein n=1 Tax=Caenorhabditis bovis TaxID=2654633 RepID=A0A8S1EVV6_9PELO|nr:unnamed protein product [Caenorhabditis bovis]